MKHFLRFVLASCLLYGASAQAATFWCPSASATQFVPSWGMVDVGENGSGRYIYQWMYWSSSSRLSGLSDNSDRTFEPDAFFYNYDGTAYGDTPTGYWGSDLPSAYRDTQLFDEFNGTNQYGEPNEVAITVGSASASSINAGQTYYTFTYMTPGGGSSSWVKLSSQRGIRVPVWCYSTYCSFGCTGTNNVPVIPFTDYFTAPGFRSYSY